MKVVNPVKEGREFGENTKKNSSYSFSGEEGKKAAEKAMSLLLFKDRTKKELTDRLYRAGFSERASLEAIDYVEQFGYINDRRYAENYVMFQKGKKSRREMVYQLTERGVADDIVSQVFEESGYEGEEQAVRMLTVKRLKGRSMCELTYEEREKNMAYLARKGYDFHVIKKVFSQLDNEHKKV